MIRIKPIVNVDRTESGVLVVSIDTTVNGVIRRIPVW